MPATAAGDNATMNEDRLIAWLRDRLGPAGAALGDDAALLAPLGEHAVTVDTQVAGVHFAPGLAAPLVARRLLAVNLSDLAAVGAEPAHALLALAAPAGFDRRPLLEALVAACEQHGVTLVGGDLSTAPVLTAALTLVGTLPAGGRWLRRDAGRPGDRLWLGGPVGWSAVGRLALARGAEASPADETGVSGELTVELPAQLAAAAPAERRALRRAVERHLAPRPQLALGRRLGRRTGPPAAAIDLSDGLGRDLHRLCRASGTGARIEIAALAGDRELATVASRLDADADALRLFGGEDYVLLFSLPAGERPPDLAAGEGRCRPIGWLTAEPEVVLVDENENSRPLAEGGWDHLS